MLKIATVNVNGIRAASKNGMADWLKKAKPDILCLQEVRAPVGELEKLASDSGPLGGGWHIAEQEASAKGRAGVAILSRIPIHKVRTDIGPKEFDTAVDGWRQILKQLWEASQLFPVTSTQERPIPPSRLRNISFLRQ